MAPRKSKPTPNASKPARTTRASSKANNTPLMQGLNSQGQAQDAPDADPAPTPAPAPQSEPVTRRPRPVPEGPLRQTRARSKLNNAPPLMKGLDDRGEARDPLSADPAPLPYDDVLERLGCGRNSTLKKANDKRRREQKVAFRAPSRVPSRAPSPVPAYVPGSVPVSVPELVAEAPASPDHDWPTVDRPIPPGSQVIWFGNGQRPARPAVANNEGDAQGTSAGDDPNQDTNATDSDTSDMDDMEDIPARPKIKIPARISRNRVVEEEDSDLSDLPETPETPSHFGSRGSDASGQSPNDGGMIISFDFEEREGSPDSLSTIEIEIEERGDEEDRPGSSDSNGFSLDGSASQGGARGHDALDDKNRDFPPSNGSSRNSIPDNYRRGSSFTPINAHLISRPSAGHSVPSDGTSLFIRSPIAPIAPMGLTTQSPSVNASVVLMESDPDDDGPDDDGPDDDSSASASQASAKSEEDDDEMDQTADTSLNVPHNCSNGSVKRGRDTDDDDEDGNAPPAKRQMLESATPSPYKKATQATVPHDSSYSSSKSQNSGGEDSNDDWAKKLGLLQSRRSSLGCLSPLIKPTIDPYVKYPNRCS